MRFRPLLLNVAISCCALSHQAMAFEETVTTIFPGFRLGMSADEFQQRYPECIMNTQDGCLVVINDQKKPESLFTETRLYARFLNKKLITYNLSAEIASLMPGSFFRSLRQASVRYGKPTTLIQGLETGMGWTTAAQWIMSDGSGTVTSYTIERKMQGGPVAKTSRFWWSPGHEAD